MTVPNRKSLRSDLVTKLKAQVTLLANDSDGTVHVFDHLVKNLNGLSPVCTIESGPTNYDLSGDSEASHAMGFIIGNWIKRDDADAAEDTLDDLIVAEVGTLRKEYNAKFTQPSMPDYETLDGVEYRIEFFAVEIDY